LSLLLSLILTVLCKRMDQFEHEAKSLLQQPRVDTGGGM